MAITAKAVQRKWWKVDQEIRNLLHLYEQGTMAMGFSPASVAAKTADLRKTVKAMSEIADAAVAESGERVV